jgi:hypothetical protein
MSEEIDKHVLRKYEIQQKLGKGVRTASCAAKTSILTAVLAYRNEPGIRHCVEGCG